MKSGFCVSEPMDNDDDDDEELKLNAGMMTWIRFATKLICICHEIALLANAS